MSKSNGNECINVCIRFIQLRNRIFMSVNASRKTMASIMLTEELKLQILKQSSTRGKNQVGVKLVIAEKIIYYGVLACILLEIKPARAEEVLVSAGK